MLLSILKLNISASIIILIVCILRFFCLNRIPKINFILLWIIVSLRLAIPFSIPSKFSIYNILEFRKNSVPYNIHNSNGVENLNTYDFVHYNIENIINNSQNIDILNMIWIIVALSIFLYFIYSYLKCIKEFKMAIPIENEFIDLWLKDLKMIRKINIMISDKISSPLTYGTIKPVILLPKFIDLKDNVKLKYVLEHELYHIKYFDTFYKIILAFTVAMNWFNPLVWVMYNLANRDIELVCDERVLNKLGSNIRKSYATCLIDFKQTKNNCTNFVNTFNKNYMEERIMSIMKFKKMSLLGTVLTLTLVGGTVTAFATDSQNNSQSQLKNTYISGSLFQSENTFDSILNGMEKIDNYDEILKDLFKPYTVEEFQQVVDNVAKDSNSEAGKSEAFKENLKKLNQTLEKLKQDNGKGDFVIYKPAIEKTVQLNGGSATVIIPAEIIMDTESIKANYTADDYRTVISTVVDALNQSVESKKITEIQKQAVLNKMVDNLSYLK